jgi:hypothetical protein
MNRHSPDPGEFVVRIAPPNSLGNGKSPRRGQEAIEAGVNRAETPEPRRLVRTRSV